MLTRNHREEGLGLAYLEAIAAEVGLNLSFSRWDYGIDLRLNPIEQSDEGFLFDNAPNLGIQLRCSTLAEMRSDSIVFDLDSRTYNFLGRTYATSGLILVLIVLPRDDSTWIIHAEHQMILSGSAYWISLRGRKPTRNRRSIRIEIPRANSFSPDAARKLFDRLKSGEPL